MNNIDPNQLLTQLRIAAAQAQGTQAAPVEQNEKVDFSALLKQSIDKVNETQQASGALGEAFDRGESNVSLEEVMIAKEKASISFQAMLQVRNKLVEVYKEVMSMPV